MKWIVENTNAESDSVIYFADDDNSYDLRIFEEVLMSINPNPHVKEDVFSLPSFVLGLTLLYCRLEKPRNYRCFQLDLSVSLEFHLPS